MKNLYLLLLVFPLIFASCDDEKNNNNVVGESWISKYTDADIETNNPKATQVIVDYLSDMHKETYVFLENGKFNHRGSLSLIITRWRPSVIPSLYLKEVINNIEAYYNYEGTYLNKNNQVTVKSNKGEFTFTLSADKSSFNTTTDETEFYQQIINYLLPEETGVIVSKVIVKQNYKKLTIHTMNSDETIWGQDSKYWGN